MTKMKLQNIAAALLLSAALAAPLSVKAADATDTTPAAATATPKPKKAPKAPQPVSAVVSAVDKTAKTFKAGTHTFTVTDSTKLEDDLTLDSLVVGTTKVTVAYTKDGDTNTATDVKAAKSAK